MEKRTGKGHIITKWFLVFICLTVAGSAFAGRSGKTKVKTIIVKKTYVEIYTETVSSPGCGGANGTRWHLKTDHPNYQAMYSGLLAARTSNSYVDIVGDGTCNVGEHIDWAYVSRD